MVEMATLSEAGSQSVPEYGLVKQKIEKKRNKNNSNTIGSLVLRLFFLSLSLSLSFFLSFFRLHSVCGRRPPGVSVCLFVVFFYCLVCSLGAGGRGRGRGRGAGQGVCREMYKNTVKSSATSTLALGSSARARSPKKYCKTSFIIIIIIISSSSIIFFFFFLSYDLLGTKEPRRTRETDETERKEVRET